MNLPKIRIRFGVRSLLIAVSLIGVGAALFAHEKRLADEQADAVGHLAKLGFDVWYAPSNERQFGSRFEPGFWRRWLGDGMFDNVCSVNGRTVFADGTDWNENLVPAVPFLRRLPCKFQLVVLVEPENDRGITSLSDCDGPGVTDSGGRVIMTS